MDETRQRTRSKLSILDLPKEILIDIFGCQDSKLPVHDPSDYWSPRITEARSRLEYLGKLRLVCRTLKRLISPFLCPVVGVSLCSGSIDRLEGLSRNPLIAQGNRGIKVSLRFRPSRVAFDFVKYYEHTMMTLGALEHGCDLIFEYEESADDRGLAHAALFRIEENKEMTELIPCYGEYVAAHVDQVCIVSDGSFLSSVVTALSRCDSPPFVWFCEENFQEVNDEDVLNVARDEGTLFRILTQGHEWYEIEQHQHLCADDDDDDDNLFFPASILTELPIACHSAGIRLRGISVDCFPLFKGYRCLLPKTAETNSKTDAHHWPRLAAACQDLEIFTFGKRGLHYGAIRPERQSVSDLAVIDGFIGAAISGRQLQKLSVGLISLEVRLHSRGRFPWIWRELENFYPASSIVTAIGTRVLRHLSLTHIDISEHDLLSLIKSVAPKHLESLYLASVTLSNGCYATAMDLLHEIVAMRRSIYAPVPNSTFHTRRSIHAPVPNITFSTLQGGEFEPPSTFEEISEHGFESQEERKEYYDKCKKRSHPELLVQVEQWISEGVAGAPNPLVNVRADKAQ